MVEVKATREGRVGRRTASGYMVDAVVPFVALPSTLALLRGVVLRNPQNGRVAFALVLDVGPWNEHDEAYVFGGERPAAEHNPDERGRVTNGAGIDLSERVWRQLAMTDNGPVQWEFWTPERYLVGARILEALDTVGGVRDLPPPRRPAATAAARPDATDPPPGQL